MNESFAARIRRAAMTLGERGATFSAAALSDEAGLQTYVERKRMRHTINDFVKTGEMRRTPERGIYQYACKSKRKPEKQLVMWRFLRFRKTVTVEELQETAEAGEEYVKEWLALLVRREIVRDCGNGNYRLLKDVMEMPVNDEKAEKLRKIRARKKARALEALRAAKTAIEEAESFVRSMEWEGVPADGEEHDEAQLADRQS